jgi:thiamine pyrophosphokinase
MNSKYVILAGAHIDDYEWLGQQINRDDIVICADSGARHAKELDITPDIVIGDFDSIAPDLLEFYSDKCAVIHDEDQNKTDLMKALDQTSHASPVSIYGAIGQRADHDFSNYLILKKLDKSDHIALRSKGETRRIVKSSITLKGNIGDKVGVFPLTPVKGLLFSGLKYASHVLPDAHDFGWNGACNEMIADTASIMFNDGTLLITHSL